MRDDIIEQYYESLMKSFPCRIEKDCYGMKYSFHSQSGCAQFKRFRLDEGLEVCLTEVDRNLSLSFDNHGYSEEMLEVGCCLEGTVEVELESACETVTIEKGDMFIYKMNNDEVRFNFQYHHSKSISISMSREAVFCHGNQAYSTRVKTAWTDEIECMFSTRPLIIEKANYKFIKHMERLASMNSNDILSLVSFKAAALEAVASAISEKRTQCDLTGPMCSDDLRLKKAIWLIDHEGENIESVKQLANLVGLSPYKIQKGFKERTGVTAYQYILKQRMTRGAALIRSTTLSIIDIANEIGYENPSKFSQVFKKRYGQSPLEYRKETQQK